MHDLVADRRGVTVAGVDDRIGRQRAQLVLDGSQDGGEVGERPAGGTGAAREQRVSGEHRAQRRGVEAGGAGGVAGGGDGPQFDAPGLQYLTIGQRPEWLVAVRGFPQHGVARIQQYGRVQVGAQLRGDGDVVVVAMSAHHGDDVAAGHGILDCLGVVGGVDDDHLGVVADDPDVVVDVPTAAVEREGAVGDDALNTAVHHSTTTDRSTSPACILWNASSTPSRPMRSETNLSRGRRPWR